MILLNLIYYRLILKHIEIWSILILLKESYCKPTWQYLAIYGNIWQWNFRYFKTYCNCKLWQAMASARDFMDFFVDVLARPIHHYLARSRKPFWCFSANVSTMSAAVCASIVQHCRLKQLSCHHPLLSLSWDECPFLGFRVILWDWLFEDWAMK